MNTPLAELFAMARPFVTETLSEGEPFLLIIAERDDVPVAMVSFVPNEDIEAREALRLVAHQFRCDSVVLLADSYIATGKDGEMLPTGHGSLGKLAAEGGIEQGLVSECLMVTRVDRYAKSDLLALPYRRRELMFARNARWVINWGDPMTFPDDTQATGAIPDYTFATPDRYLFPPTSPDPDRSAVTALTALGMFVTLNPFKARAS